jgi:hypothetical protein
MTDKPTFVLFRFPNASNQKAGIGEYVGALVIEVQGVKRCYAIDAEVRDYEKPDHTKGKYFAGRVLGGQAVRESMMRNATGEIPADLVTQMEAVPFDDPLPRGIGIGTEGEGVDVLPTSKSDADPDAEA